jgi:DNA-binding NtrC family response regulator
MTTGFTRPGHASTLTNPPRASKANADEARGRADEPATTILSVSHLVEDHVYLRRLRDRARWETREAYCCREAIAAIAEQHPDVVLCEASLPDGNWKDLLEDLSRRLNPPYLIVTSHVADEHLWAEVLNMGGYDVLAKPFDPEELCRVVQFACEHHQERQIRRAAGGNATTARGSSSEHGAVRSAGSTTASRAAC